MTGQRMIALDLFAGHGWGVACQRLGIEEYGVEIMPEAVATRGANGMHTIYRDVWAGLAEEVRSSIFDRYDLLIASPPCQTFSMAGGGAGRRALDDVLALIDERAYLDVAELRAFGETHDPRTTLVLTPLAHVFRDAPLYVVFEQVPPVLPVWERCAEEMRRWGYSVWTGIVNAEQYGVPQTRRRAILIARADGVEAKMPTPTHSRYYSRDPKRLDEGVLPWVSMAEALGWGMTERPRIMRSNYGTGGDPAARGERPVDDPAPTMTSKADRNLWEERPAPTVTGGGGATGGAEVFGRRGREIIAKMHLDPSKPATTVAGDPRLSSRDHHEHGAQSGRASRVTVEEAAALQSYPAGFTFAGTKTKQFLQIGNAVPPLLAEAILRAVTEPGDPS